MLVAKVPGKLPGKVLGAFDLQRQYTQLTCDTATISNKAYQHSCMNHLLPEEVSRAVLRETGLGDINPEPLARFWRRRSINAFPGLYRKKLL